MSPTVEQSLERKAEGNPSGDELGNIAESLAIQLNYQGFLKSKGIDVDKVKTYENAAMYMAAAMLYLRDNCLLEEPLKKENIKERLLGHWGTCPGIIFTW